MWSSFFVNSENLSSLQFLAVITEIRILASQKNFNISEALYDSKLLGAVEIALEGNFDEYTKYVQLEAVWVLINVGYGPKHDCRLTFTPKIISSINTILTQNDFQLLDEVYFFLSNIISNSTHLQNMVVREYNPIEKIKNMFCQNEKIQVSNLLNIFFILKTLTGKKSKL